MTQKLGRGEAISEALRAMTLGTPSGSQSGAALTDSQFVVLTADANLASERVLVGGAGLTLTDGGAGGNVTLAVGAGDGISVAADSVAVDSTVVRTTRTLTAGAGLTGGGDLSADRTFAVGAGTGITVNADDVAVNTSAAFTWGGAHVFSSTAAFTTISSNLIPTATDTYDLGSSTKMWRKGYLSELDAVLFAQNVVTVIGGWLLISKGEGVLGADLGSLVGDTTASLGTTANITAHATTGDIILFRGLGQVEYMKVTAGTGPTWTVTRDLDGSGRNAWPAGSVFVNLGYSTTGRIELNASDTPRISIIKQGTTYNAQTELVRIGDLNGWGGFVAEQYGWAVGDYSGGNYAYYGTSAGFRLSAGAGGVNIDNTGVQFVSPASYDVHSSLSWAASVGGAIHSEIYNTFSSGASSLNINVRETAGNSSSVGMQANGPTGKSGSASLVAYGNGGAGGTVASVTASMSAAGVTTVQATATTITESCDTWQLSGGIGGGTVVGIVKNSNTASASSHAQLAVSTGNGSAGDPYVLISVTGVTDWHVGVDNSDSDKLKIGTGTAIGTNTLLTLVSGTITLNADARVINGLYVGSDTDPSDNDITYDGVLKSAKNSTTYTGYIFVPLTTLLTSTSYDGNDTVTTGTTTIDTSATFSAPVGIKAALVRVQATWASAAAASTLSLRKVGDAATVYGAIRAHNTNAQEMTIIAICDSNGDFDLVVANANATSVTMTILGYFI